MASPAVVVRSDQDTLEAAGLLAQRRIKRLPVVDESNRWWELSRGQIS